MIDNCSGYTVAGERVGALTERYAASLNSGEKQVWRTDHESRPQPGGGQVDSSTCGRSDAPGGQRCALPTVRVSAHLPTAFHHQVDMAAGIKIQVSSATGHETEKHRGVGGTPPTAEAKRSGLPARAFAASTAVLLTNMKKAA